MAPRDVRTSVDDAEMDASEPEMTTSLRGVKACAAEMESQFR
jgi:hypothetical protein